MGIKNKKGFSLVELIAVMAMFAILTSIGLVSMSANRTIKELETEARKVAASIREAQNDALIGKIGPSGSLPCQFIWRNWINGVAPNPTDNTSYWVRSWKNDATGVCNTNNFDDLKYVLQNGVSFHNASGASDVFFFSVPFANFTDSSSGTPDGAVILKKGSRCIQVEIVSGHSVVEGQVYDC